MDNKRSRHAVDLDNFTKYTTQLSSIQDPELVLLKAHMLVERVLVQVLAARLREPDVETVPRLSFGSVVDLAIRRPEDRNQFLWLNELRNALAHEFNGVEGAAFTSAIKKFGLEWPTDAKEQRAVVVTLADYVLLLAWLRYFDEMSEQLTLERAATLPGNAEPFLERGMKIARQVETVRSRLDELGRHLQKPAMFTAPPLQKS
jgi:PHD/YefM family antitoxin component YafN of YafNO toxin-antitoxin module